MAKISKMQVGQILFSVEPVKMGNTTITIKELYTVRITEIDPEHEFVMASWNNNPAKKYYQSSCDKWKVKEPKVKSSVWGRDSY